MAKRSGDSSSSGKTRRSSGDSGIGTDKSVEAFREALERSVTLSRERLQEVVDDAVRHGRLTRRDANELVSRLLDRGRKQTEGLLRDLERLLGQTRNRLQRRTAAGASPPIAGYDQLTVKQVSSRLGKLSAADLRRVRDYERRHKNRKGIQAEIEKRLG
jgi:polyhydroxyalkanoate synthesis regulator phasin